MSNNDWMRKVRKGVFYLGGVAVCGAAFFPSALRVPAGTQGWFFLAAVCWLFSVCTGVIN